MIKIEKVTRSDELGAVLALQKLAFHSEAVLYNDFSLPPLLQTEKQLLEEFHNGKTFLKHMSGDDTIGSIRAALDKNNYCHIGRLVVHPEYQQLGIGTALMQAIEAAFPACKEYRIFTGHKSLHVIHLYKKLGYSIFDKQDAGSHIIVYMQKTNYRPLNQAVND